jgi:formylglycine-generating enzyme required for sulfatase activity
MDLRKKSGFREKLLEEKMERLALSQDTRFDNISYVKVIRLKKTIETNIQAGECDRVLQAIDRLQKIGKELSTDQSLFLEARCLYKARRFSETLAALEKYFAVINAKHPHFNNALAIYEDAEIELNKDSSRSAAISELNHKLAKTSEEDAQEKLRIYSRLAEFVPASSQYKAQILYYQERVYPEELINSIGIEFLRIPPGSFQMESQSLYGDESIQEVSITRTYYLSKYEVTQGQWESVTGKNPSKFKDCGKSCPVEQVNWVEVQQFIIALNKRENCSMPSSLSVVEKEGLHSLAPGCYRLPTEAEWAYAANESPISWHEGNSNRSVHRVGQKAPNQHGLHDMLGNVWEWVLDKYDRNYYWHCRNECADPVNLWSGTKRVRRGGSWYHPEKYSSKSYRGKDAPETRNHRLGFRLLRVAGP